MIASMLAACVIGLGTAAPTPLPDSPPGVPHFERYRLDNGLEVVLFESRSSPWLEAHLVFGAGTLSDPAGLSGLAATTAGSMMAGIPGATETELSDRLARLGASIDVSAGSETLTISGGIPTQDPKAVRTFVETLIAVALRPTLPDDLIARDKARRIANISRLTSRHGTLADTALRRAVFGATPDGMPSFGVLQDIERITPDDVRAWHRRVASPTHAVLLVGGSFDKAPLLAWIDAHLGETAWPRGVITCKPGTFEGQCASLCDAAGCLVNPAATPRPISAAGNANRRVLVTIEDDNAAQIQWRMGFANAVAAIDSSYGALRVGFHVLGGDFTARLNQVLRAKEGLTYGAYASADFGAYRPGLSFIRTDAPPATLTRAIELTRGLIRQIREEVIPTTELTEVRANLANGFAFRFESVSDTLAQLRFITTNHLPLTWLPNWIETVTAPSAESIRDALAAAIPADGGHLVVVGPASVLGTLQAMDPSEPWVTISAKDLLAGGPGHDAFNGPAGASSKSSEQKASAKGE